MTTDLFSLSIKETCDVMLTGINWCAMVVVGKQYHIRRPELLPHNWNMMMIFVHRSAKITITSSSFKCIGVRRCLVKPILSWKYLSHVEHICSVAAVGMHAALVLRTSRFLPHSAQRLSSAFFKSLFVARQERRS